MNTRAGLGDETGRVFRVPGGLLEYRFAPGGTVEVVNIEVDSEVRRKGIGRELMYLVECLNEAEVVYGFTAGSNRIAQQFYTALGYKLVNISEFYGPHQHAYLFHKIIKEKLGDGAIPSPGT
jgi:ribosomal protein S18 acetylase RimI-like enzyme